jgi:hypothetical protein
MNPGAVLLLTDGEVWSFVKHGRRAEPMTIFACQRGGDEREIQLVEVAHVMSSP